MVQTSVSPPPELTRQPESRTGDIRSYTVSLWPPSYSIYIPFLSPSAGLNDLYSATQKNLGTETKLRQQLEQELEMQRSIRQEKEVSYSFFPTIRKCSRHSCTHAGCKGDSQQGLSEDTESGGEACPAHSQQQEDGEGVSHSLRNHS